MRNQPKYSFFKNTTYALKGMKDLISNETSFKIELILCIILVPFIFLFDFSTTHQILLFISLLAMLIAEATNSAIERVVDLVTLDHHEMAGRAKDVGSSIVFLSIIVFVVTWAIILLEYFF